MIEEMNKKNKVNKFLDPSVMFAMFGHENIFEVLVVKLKLLDSLRRAIEILELNQQDNKDTYSANEVRLANMLMVNSNIKEVKGKTELTSILRENIEQTMERDIIL